jgi:hypothetical protein
MKIQMCGISLTVQPKLCWKDSEMKVSELVTLIDAHIAGEPDVEMLVQSLRKFSDFDVSFVTEKLKTMKVPKVRPAEAAKELSSQFQDSRVFETRLSEMETSRDYTKAVFLHIYQSLFPNAGRLPKSIKRADLVERIRKQRRRDENLATG